MTDDELLALLGERERTERSRATAWETVARGEASPEAASRLADEDGAAMAKAAAPFDDAAVDRIVGRIDAVRAGRTPLEVAPAPVAQLADARTRRTRRLAAIMAPLAAAAVIVLALRGGLAPSEPQGDLPSYALSVGGGTAVARGAAMPTERLTLGGSLDQTFDVVARPATATSRAPVARAFAWKAGAPARPLGSEVSIEVAPSGSVRVRGTANALDGATELRVVIAASAITDADLSMISEDAPAGRAGARVLRVIIDRR